MPEIPLVVENLSFQYRRRDELAIANMSFELQAGQVMLIAGASGCGKTTLMRCINGLIPNTYTGEMTGDIRLFGKSVRQMPMGEISQTVGTLLQDPERQILGSYVLNEVAFGLESLGVAREEITPRVEKALSRLAFSTCVTVRPSALLAAKNKRSRWRACWQWNHGSCCSMSRWQTLTPLPRMKLWMLSVYWRMKGIP